VLLSPRLELETKREVALVFGDWSEGVIGTVMLRPFAGGTHEEVGPAVANVKFAWVAAVRGHLAFRQDRREVECKFEGR
jgi:hypothetical protein